MPAPNNSVNIKIIVESQRWKRRTTLSVHEHALTWYHFHFQTFICALGAGGCGQPPLRKAGNYSLIVEIYTERQS